MERNKINSECRFAGLKGDRLEYKCRECREKRHDSITKFPSIYQFCNGDLNKFILLLRKGVYPYEDIDIWEKFEETTIPPKKAFYSKLNLENISDEDYAHVQKVWKVFGIKNRGEYHDLYVLCDTFLLADVFGNFRDKCIEIYGLDPTYFVSVFTLAWEDCLKKTEVELESLTDYNMLLMIEKGIRGGICQATHRYAKANNKYMNNYNEDIESSYIAYLDANNLYGWTMSQKVPVNGFKWVKKSSKFDEDFIKKYDENSNTGYFLEVDVEYPKTLSNSHKDLPFLPKRKKVEKVEKLICSIEDKEKYVIHIRALKKALNYGLKLKNVHRVIKFNQRAWLKPYININTELKENTKNEFQRISLS